jgi:hypothetical protein
MDRKELISLELSLGHSFLRVFDVEQDTEHKAAALKNASLSLKIALEIAQVLPSEEVSQFASQLQLLEEAIGRRAVAEKT